MARCDTCDQEFEHESSLQQHRQAKHSSGATIKSGPKKGWLKYLAIVIVLVAVGGGVFVFTGQNQQPTAQFVNQGTTAGSIDYALSWYSSHNDLHWHPELTIRINGQTQIIPADVGITPTKHYPVHTHDSSGTLHWELQSPPTEQNMKLGYFFNSVWNKKFNSQCIFDKCNDGTKSVKFTVNGKPNTDFDNYLIHDKDKIEIEYS